MGTITVTNLGKAFRQYPNRWSRLAEWVLPGTKPRHTLKWVMQGVSFTVNPGEAVGIIGINGAGKSTLLKMITGTTQPTTGNVHVNGRVAALLELGMGFHPDFTGRQNAYMAGQLSGRSAEDITRLMPEIEAFAEIGEYIDRPIRTYSSGMQLRLAFSVATMAQPDILIIDEALAVGDSYFQHKCTERIKGFLGQGTTLLFVSHSPGAIKSLCNRAMMISEGRIIHDGSPDEVMDHYNAMIAKRTSNYHIHQEKAADGRTITRSGTGKAKIMGIDIQENERSVRAIITGSSVVIRLSVKALSDLENISAGILIRDKWGSDVWGTNTYLHKIVKSMANQTTTVFSFSIDKLSLGPGSYSISAAVHAADNHLVENYDWADRLSTFDIIQNQQANFTGLIDLPVKVIASN